MALCYFTYPVSHATRNSTFRCNYRSSPNGCLELECPFSKPYIIVCACQRDCLQTVMPLCHTLVQLPPILPHLPFRKSSCRPLGLLYLPETALWMDWDGRLSVSRACERDSFCYSCEVLFSASSELSRETWSHTCNQLS